MLMSTAVLTKRPSGRLLVDETMRLIEGAMQEGINVT